MGTRSHRSGKRNRAPKFKPTIVSFRCSTNFLEPLRAGWCCGPIYDGTVLGPLSRGSQFRGGDSHSAEEAPDLGQAFRLE